MTASLRPHDLCDHVIIRCLSLHPTHQPTSTCFSNDHHPQGTQGERSPRCQMVMSSSAGLPSLTPSEPGLYVKSHLKTHDSEAIIHSPFLILSLLLLFYLGQRGGAYGGLYWASYVCFLIVLILFLSIESTVNNSGVSSGWPGKCGSPYSYKYSILFQNSFPFRFITKTFLTPTIRRLGRWGPRWPVQQKIQTLIPV